MFAHRIRVVLGGWTGVKLRPELSRLSAVSERVFYSIRLVSQKCLNMFQKIRQQSTRTLKGMGMSGRQVKACWIFFA